MHGVQASQDSQISPPWKASRSSGMIRRGSWLDLDHAASAEGLGQTALLRSEETHGTCCSTLLLRM